MKILLLIIGLLISTVTAFSDTVDYWHVSYNKKVVAKLNSTSEDFTLSLYRNKVKGTDKITVRFGEDTPCSNCFSFLLVLDERKNKIGLTQTNRIWGALTLSINDLLELVRKYDSRRLDFYYYERKVVWTKPRRLLFHMNIK